jgi:hypothetical protein
MGRASNSFQSHSALPSSSGSRAMLMAIRRASSGVSILACNASVGLSREYRYATLRERRDSALTPESLDRGEP